MTSELPKLQFLRGHDTTIYVHYPFRGDLEDSPPKLPVACGKFDRHTSNWILKEPLRCADDKVIEAESSSYALVSVVRVVIAQQ